MTSVDCLQCGGPITTRGANLTAEEAAHAYDEAARKHFGEFGRFNFPRPGEQSALSD